MAQVGLCLNAWSQIETSMALTFSGVSGISNYSDAGTIFDAIVSFETRLAVLDTAISIQLTYITDEEREVWTALSARLRKLYKKRHEVAHFSVDYNTINENPGISPFFSYNRQRRGEAKFLTLKQMQERSQIFTGHAQAVSWFNNIIGRRRLPPEFRPQAIPEPELIVRIQELIALKKAGQMSLPESSQE